MTELKRSYYIEEDSFSNEFKYLFEDILNIESASSEGRSDERNDTLIHCHFREEGKTSSAEDVYAEDFFLLPDKLDLEQYIGNRKLIIYGAGNSTKEFLNEKVF